MYGVLHHVQQSPASSQQPGSSSTAQQHQSEADAVTDAELAQLGAKVAVAAAETNSIDSSLPAEHSSEAPTIPTALEELVDAELSQLERDVCV